MMMAGSESILWADSLTQSRVSAEELSALVLDMEVVVDLREKIAEAEAWYLPEFDAFVAKWNWLGNWLAAGGLSAMQESLAAAHASVPEPAYC